MKKSFKKYVACILMAALVISLPAFGVYASGSEKTVGWYLIERFNDTEFSLATTDDVVPDPAGSSTASGWYAYWRSSKGTIYGTINTVADANAPYDKYLSINRGVTSTTNAVVNFGYHDVNGFTDDEFVVDMDVFILPGDEEYTGGHFKNSITIGSAYGSASAVGYIVFTTDDVDGSGARTNVVKYYDNSTQTEIEIPELRNYETGEDHWYSVRLIINNVTNTYDFYFADGKDGVFGEPAKTGIAFDDVTLKQIYLSAHRNASDADGLCGGGIIGLDNLKIGVETDAANLYRTGKADSESIDFEDIALNDSLASTPDESFPMEIACGNSKGATRFGNVLIGAEGSNHIMRVNKNSKYTSTVYASYPVADGLNKNDGITTVQLRYKNANIDNQFDRIQLFTAADIANGTYDYGAHLLFADGVVYVADASGEDFGADTLPLFAKVANAETMVANQWYTIKFVVDFNTLTYDVYLSTDVDGGESPIVTDAPLYKEESDSYTAPEENKIRRIHFSTYYNTSTEIGGYSMFYIDDLLVNPTPCDDLYDSINIDSSLIAEGTLSVNVPLNLITYNSSFEAEEIAHKMIVAVYDSQNSLKAIDINPGVFNGSSISKTVTFDPTVYENGNVKVFLLDGFASLLPLGSFETLS